MILPGKHLKPDRALLSVGGEILAVLGAEATVSTVWDNVRAHRAKRAGTSPLPLDWFLLALSLLFAIGAIDLDGDLLTKRTPQ